MTHHFPWLQEGSRVYFTFEVCRCPLFLPSPSPTTDRVSDVFGIYFLTRTNPTLYPHLFPISAPSLQGLLPSSHLITLEVSVDTAGYLPLHLLTCYCLHSLLTSCYRD